MAAKRKRSPEVERAIERLREIYAATRNPEAYARKHHPPSAERGYADAYAIGACHVLAEQALEYLGVPPTKSEGR